TLTTHGTPYASLQPGIREHQHSPGAATLAAMMLPDEMSQVTMPAAGIPEEGEDRE
ncbi:unnamed protein product, partial [Heterosigma akashiwo]